ncbi:MAG: bifunctional oligoribonuclease/PAP phosphatase NrnA [Planctomycetaceae bacterium]
MPELDWAPLRSIIENHQSFLITSHVRPDADALGSELGMAAILQAFGKRVTILNATAPPQNLLFMNRNGTVCKLGEDLEKADIPQTDVCIVVDTSAWQQLGAMADVVQKAGGIRVVIDHHISSDNLGATEFRDIEAAATGELIFEAAQALGIEFDADTAAFLYAAIATDTGWFRFPSTTARTMKIAASLMQCGAEPHVLYGLVNEQRSLAQVRLAGRVLSRIHTECDGRLVWISADKTDFEETKALPSDTESLVNQCLTVAGSEAAFIAVELQSGMVKFSLRCRPPYDVAALAEKFSGGGHKLASGATLPGPFSEAVESIRSGFHAMLAGSER